MKKDQDFRAAFALMDPRAVISREELALLLCRSPAAVSLMAYRGKLPRRAFPGERKACWFVQDVKDWLDELASSQPAENQDGDAAERRVGRPRKSVV
ncbi:hypothetical protein LMG19087_00254 [Ralstonia wenshanensis]|uniref:hypothetical protein n=1 Tax=Ralstonia wenshanensis TaxID=2842456 RepID=UPI0028F56703|nr:hypothetical protein [Ralstonia wenshanensis]CAJ0808575.1 hypothetical protein LMG19087_00254 [Ralstonia wenshanensis]